MFVHPVSLLLWPAVATMAAIALRVDALVTPQAGLSNAVVCGLVSKVVSSASNVYYPGEWGEYSIKDFYRRLIRAFREHRLHDR